MKAWKILGAMAAISALASSALAQPWDGQGPGGRGKVGGPGFGGPERMGGAILVRALDNDKLVERLGLTEEQVSKAKASIQETQKKLIRLRADAELADLEARNLLQADAADRDAVLKAVEAAGAAHTAIRKAAAEERLNLRDILGADTMAKIRQHMSDRIADRRDNRRDKGSRQDGGRPGRGAGPGVPGQGPAWMQDEMPPPAE